MTKEMLIQHLKSGKTMADAFTFRPGQECEIYKADAFHSCNDIIYIPDLSLNRIPILNPFLDNEEIEEILANCYTGRDFVDICEGNKVLAAELFWFCDWQHPSSAYDEGIF